MTPILLELLGSVTLHDVSGSGVLRSEVGHHVAVPPAGKGARLFPRLRVRELHGPAEPLALRLCDPEQRGAVQAHGAESYSTGRARSARRSGRPERRPLM